MKYLTLLRHAKSDWADASLSDIERPLNARGLSAAPAMGRYLRRKKIAPDLILCSSAVRTRQTLNHLAPKLDVHPETIITEKLYLASPNDMLLMIRATDDAYQHILMIGHNPGTHHLALDLCNEERTDPDIFVRVAPKFPTAAVAHFEFSVDSWTSVQHNSGHLMFFKTPKSLDSKDTRD